MRFPSAVLALLATIPLGACEDLQADWVKEDLAVAKRVAAVLPPGDRTRAAWLEALGEHDVREDRDIGFGARRLRLAVYGGYTTTWITALVHADRVGPLLVEPSASEEEAWKELSTPVAKAYAALDPRAGDRRFRIEVGRSAGPDGFRSAREKVLGPPLGVDPAPALADAYSLLWSPFSDLAYGWACYEDGAPPDGRQALEKLLADPAGDPLLVDLVRGPNPEGRLYAAEGLLRQAAKGKPHTPETTAAIAWIRKSDVKIHVCRGCMVSDDAAAGALDEMLAEAARK